MTALAFLFAVFLARPCPFYILDEVEAALDDLNIDRFLGAAAPVRDRAQFIVVTHQKRTMEAADCLYGVSMAGNGVSKVVSRRLPLRRSSRRSLRDMSVSPDPAMGPLQLLVIGFETTERFRGDIARELRDLRGRGLVRVLDARLRLALDPTAR